MIGRCTMFSRLTSAHVSLSRPTQPLRGLASPAHRRAHASKSTSAEWAAGSRAWSGWALVSKETRWFSREPFDIQRNVQSYIGGILDMSNRNLSFQMESCRLPAQRRPSAASCSSRGAPRCASAPSAPRPPARPASAVNLNSRGIPPGPRNSTP